MYLAIKDKIRKTHVSIQVSSVYHKCHIIECLDKLVGESTRDFVLDTPMPTQKRLYDCRSSNTIAFSAREYGYGPMIVAIKDIEREAETDIDSYKLVKRFKKRPKLDEN